MINHLYGAIVSTDKPVCALLAEL